MDPVYRIVNLSEKEWNFVRILIEFHDENDLKEHFGALCGGDEERFDILMAKFEIEQFEGK